MRIALILQLSSDSTPPPHSSTAPGHSVAWELRNICVHIQCISTIMHANKCPPSAAGHAGGRLSCSMGHTLRTHRLGTRREGVGPEEDQTRHATTHDHVHTHTPIHPHSSSDPIEVVSSFQHLGSFVGDSCSSDAEVSVHIAGASQAFRSLSCLLCYQRKI